MDGLYRCSNCAACYAKPAHLTAGPCCPLCLVPLPPLWTVDDQRRIREPGYVPPAVPPKPKRQRPHGPSPAWKRKVAQLRERDGDGCWLCGEPLGGTVGGAVTLDHVIPRSKGGGNALANLRLAHKRCNRRRGNADPPQDMAA